MLKAVSARKVWWPVLLNVAVGDGEIEHQDFQMQFDIRDVDANRELMNSAADLKITADQKLAGVFAEFVTKLASDWRDVEFEEGVPTPFTKENLTQAMGVTGAFEAVLEAFRDCSRGEKASRAGN